ncbi:cyclase [Streptomyces albireticuli]|uniref:Cyclase n=1 Tax=Streptomyces albireticuli TaxID=1940 RepID=A0A1Z2KXQ7_9ACTN|nr:aromatase/cyclase [Streptomyces albireticuli]ARZ66809.1 cyclase [Streptomyces albireticuli]
MTGSGPPRVHRTEHSLIVSAPPERLYALIADAASWPAVFGPCVHVRHLARTDRSERFELWAEVNGEVRRWTSRRTLVPERFYVGFRQERSAPPVASMAGAWLLRPLPGRRTEVVLRHRFTTVGDDPVAPAGVSAALDRNSRSELAALARVSESGHPVRDVVLTFSDTIEAACPAEAAYTFVERADLWAERLPHVSRSELTEIAPGVQELAMETVTPDGAAHTTRSVRVCHRPGWIAYKQRVLPKPLLGHSGLWTFEDAGAGRGARATARHTVVIDAAAVPSVLGEGATLTDARSYVRRALGDNSRTTLSLAAGAGTAAR